MELLHWQAYFSLDPWSEERKDLRAGTIAAVIANQWRDSNKPPIGPLDLLPQWGPGREDQRQAVDLRTLSKDEIRAAAMGLTEAIDPKKEG